MFVHDLNGVNFSQHPVPCQFLRTNFTSIYSSTFCSFQKNTRVIRASNKTYIIIVNDNFSDMKCKRSYVNTLLLFTFHLINSVDI